MAAGLQIKDKHRSDRRKTTDRRIRPSECLSATCSWADEALREIGGPLSVTARRLIRTQQWVRLGRLNMPTPSRYVGRKLDFARDYAAYNLLRKYADFPIDLDRKGAALEAFHESEARCAAFNTRGEWSYPYDPFVSLELQVTSVLYRARAIIARILGQLHVPRWFEECTFTSGASTRLRRKAGDPYYKLQGILECTANCRNLVSAYIDDCPLWAYAKCEEIGSNRSGWTTVVRGSRYTTVPKDWKTERGITPQPEGNMLLQSGLGALIRKRLLRAGCDLNDQTVNQHLAKLAYSLGLATVDLKQASDSVTIRLCSELLPKEWLHAIMLTRTSHTLLPSGKWHQLEQISSMGNGYTFELESLLFYGICLATCEATETSTEHVSVYGDDIVIPSAAVNTLFRVLRAASFVVNKDKSFVDGPFFESCGKHYFEGVDVTPFYIKESLDGLETYHRLHNRAREWFIPLETLCDRLRRDVPGCLVPYDFPDTSGYWVSWDEACPKYDRIGRGWRVKSLQPKTDMHEIGSSDWGYLRALLKPSRQERSITGFLRGTMWCITHSDCPLPALSVSKDQYRKVSGTIHSWSDWDFVRPQLSSR